MTNTLVTSALIYLHVISLALWFGGLFGYLVMVWPAILSQANGEFPRELLVTIAMRTAPWIFVCMASAVASFLLIWLMGVVSVRTPWMVVYGLCLAGLVGNNVYGTMVAWPRIMFMPESSVAREWLWFRVRMGVSLAVGLALYSAAVLVS